MNVTMVDDVTLNMRLLKRWNRIPYTREYLREFLSLNDICETDISKIEVSASELLENSIRHSSNDNDYIFLSLHKERESRRLNLSVSNYCDEGNRNAIIERIKEIHISDPFEYYMYRLFQSVKDRSKSSGLGLARVYYEGNAALSVDLKDDGQVSVMAEFKL